MAYSTFVAVVLITALVSLSPAQADPRWPSYIILDPRPGAVTEGATFEFNCGVNRSQMTNPVDVSWKKCPMDDEHCGSAHIEQDSTQRVQTLLSYENGAYISRLIIQNVEAADAGFYYCHVEMPDYEPQFRVTLNVIPRADESSNDGDNNAGPDAGATYEPLPDFMIPENLTGPYPIGTTAALRCGVELSKIERHQVQDVQWWMYNEDGTPYRVDDNEDEPMDIKTKRRSYIITLTKNNQFTKKLIINKLQETDERNYICIVVTELGEFRNHLRLKLTPAIETARKQRRNRKSERQNAQKE